MLADVPLTVTVLFGWIRTQVVVPALPCPGSWRGITVRISDSTSSYLGLPAFEDSLPAVLLSFLGPTVLASPRYVSGQLVVGASSGLELASVVTSAGFEEVAPKARGYSVKVAGEDVVEKPDNREFPGVSRGCWVSPSPVVVGGGSSVVGEVVIEFVKLPTSRTLLETVAGIVNEPAEERH